MQRERERQRERSKEYKTGRKHLVLFYLEQLQFIGSKPFQKLYPTGFSLFLLVEWILQFNEANIKRCRQFIRRS